jgi:hypothetical protein
MQKYNKILQTSEMKFFKIHYEKDDGLKIGRKEKRMKRR